MAAATVATAMVTEDQVYRASTQYRLWSFSPEALASLRASTNALAAERVRAAIRKRTGEQQQQQRRQSQQGSAGVNADVGAAGVDNQSTDAASVGGDNGGRAKDGSSRISGGAGGGRGEEGGGGGPSANGTSSGNGEEVSTEADGGSGGSSGGIAMPEIDCLTVEEEQKLVEYYSVKAMGLADFCSFPTNVKVRITATRH